MFKSSTLRARDLFVTYKIYALLHVSARTNSQNVRYIYNIHSVDQTKNKYLCSFTLTCLIRYTEVAIE